MSSVLASLWILASGLFFTLMGALIRIAGSAHTVSEMLLWRSLVGIAILAAIILAAGDHFIPKKGTRMLHAKRCAWGTASITLSCWTLTVMPFGTSQALSYTSAIFVGAAAVLMALINREKPEWLLQAVLLIGFGGILVILRPEATGLLEGFAGLMSGLTGAIASIEVVMLGRAGESNARTVFWFSVAGAVAGLAGMAFIDGAFPMPSMHDALLLAGIGVMAAAGQLSMNEGWQRGHMVLAAVFSLSGIPFSVVLGAIAFGERTDALTLAGIGIVLASGIAATLLRLKAKN